MCRTPNQGRVIQDTGGHVHTGKHTGLEAQKQNGVTREPSEMVGLTEIQGRKSFKRHSQVQNVPGQSKSCERPPLGRRVVAALRAALSQHGPGHSAQSAPLHSVLSPGALGAKRRPRSALSTHVLNHGLCRLRLSSYRTGNCEPTNFSNFSAPIQLSATAGQRSHRR